MDLSPREKASRQVEWVQRDRAAAGLAWGWAAFGAKATAGRETCFPGGSDSKESACNAGDAGSIPGLERSPGEGNGNPMDRGAVGSQSRTQLSDWHFHFLSECIEARKAEMYLLCCKFSIKSHCKKTDTRNFICEFWKINFLISKFKPFCFQKSGINVGLK